MYAIYGNIYHQYTQMLAYILFMDPMGYEVNILELAAWKHVSISFYFFSGGAIYCHSWYKNMTKKWGKHKHNTWGIHVTSSEFPFFEDM